MKKSITLLLLAVIIVSCYRIVPAPDFNMKLVIPADSMVAVLVDMHLAEGMVNIEHKNGKAIEQLSGEYFHTVLERHNITPDIFDESIRYYSFYSEELDKIYEKVIIDLSKLESIVIQKMDDNDSLTLNK